MTKPNSTALAKYDPKVEGAALALLDKMHKALAEVKTMTEAKDLHSLAKVARERASSIPTYNKATALIFAAEVVMGQMLLKEGRAPNTGAAGSKLPNKERGLITGPRSADSPPTLQEILGVRDSHTAKNLALAFRKLAESVTVEQVHAAEKLLTKYNDKLTRKAVTLVASSAWEPSSEKKPKPDKKEGQSRFAGQAPARLFDELQRRVNTKDALDILLELKDQKYDVEEGLRLLRAFAGWLRSARGVKA